MIGKWTHNGYILRYRPMLGELTEAVPHDPFPEVMVLGGIDDGDPPNFGPCSTGTRGSAIA